MCAGVCAQEHRGKKEGCGKGKRVRGATRVSYRRKKIEGKSRVRDMAKKQCNASEIVEELVFAERELG